MMTYQEAVAYLYDIPKFTKKHSVEQTREFLKRLGNPEKGQRIIHVAGTNGKGSVCAYMQAMLTAEGKNVGFFTSPHLIFVNERIRINNRQIDDETFLKVFLKVKETVDGMAEDGLSHPSYFEFLFGMGMLAFAQEKLDYVILETGLGGRLDATNSIEEPVLTIITSISLDHTQYLGDTVAKIAYEKAGIIKKHVPVICDGSSQEAVNVIRAQAAVLGTECREIPNHAFEIQEITDRHIAFSRVNAYDKGVIWQLNNCGLYQMMNASIAIAAMEQLFPTPDSHYEKWKNALAGVVWEGRLEEVKPGVFVDGAHNPGAIRAFVETIRAIRLKERPILVFAAVEDKEYDLMVQELCQNIDAKAYIITEVEDKRKVSAGTMADVFRKYTDQPVFEIANISDACQTAIDMRLDEALVQQLAEGSAVWSAVLAMCLVLFGTATAIKHAPVDHFNKPVSAARKQLMRKRCLRFQLLFVLLTALLLAKQAMLYALCLALGNGIAAAFLLFAYYQKKGGNHA